MIKIAYFTVLILLLLPLATQAWASEEWASIEIEDGVPTSLGVCPQRNTTLVIRSGDIKFTIRYGGTMGNMGFSLHAYPWQNESVIACEWTVTNIVVTASDLTNGPWSHKLWYKLVDADDGTNPPIPAPEPTPPTTPPPMRVWVYYFPVLR